jgi:opacity protein-like surface antigen
MAILKTLSLAGIVAAGLASSASAADMLFPPMMESAGPPGMVELGTGWYLRGDAAYVDYLKPKDRAAIVDQTFEKTKLDRTWSAGGGFGYKFTNLLRADVTVDHRFDSDFEGTRSPFGFGTGSQRELARLESTTGLVNGYVDLGNWWGVTPYVGAGVGAVMHSLHDYNIQLTCLTAACGTVGAQTTTKIPGRRSYDLAWALMGGVAVDVGGGFKIDAGYRYVNLGEAEMRYPGASASTRGKAIEAHEVRLGLRYMIDQ